MLDVALRRVDGSTTVDPALLRQRATPPLPVDPALAALLPNGLRRGSTLSVTGSASLLLAVLGAASAAGAWCALVGFGGPDGQSRLSAEAAAEYDIDLSRLAFVHPLDGRGWTTAVGALLDTVDIVAARPPRLVPSDITRLAARARTRQAVLITYLSAAQSWAGADVRLGAGKPEWVGIGAGAGRLTARRVEVTANGRGAAARSRSATLWLPAHGGGAQATEPVVELSVSAQLVAEPEMSLVG